MNTVDVQTQESVDRGERVTMSRFVTDQTEYEVIRQLVFDLNGVTGYDELNQFGRKILNIEIKEFPNELMEI